MSVDQLLKPPKILPIAQSLWLQTKMTVMEHMCIQSFLNWGYEFHLYTYGEVAGVPEGATIKSAEEIIPVADIPELLKDQYQYFYAGKRSALFADFFRIKLLIDQGGLWVDCDTFCINPFPTEEVEYMFCKVGEEPSGYYLANSPMYARDKSSGFFLLAWEAIVRATTLPDYKDPNFGTDITYNSRGPGMVAALVTYLDYERFCRPVDEFFSISADEYWKFLEPGRIANMGHLYSLHFWNRNWEIHNIDKNKIYFNSLYEDMIEQTECRTGSSFCGPHALDWCPVDDRPKGWFDEVDAAHYIKAIQDRPGDSIVEIGCWMGRSLDYVMPTALENNCKVYAIDPWDTACGYPGRSRRAKFDFNMQKRGFRQHIEILQMLSEDAADNFEDASLGVVYLDGSHAFLDVFQDIMLYWPKLKEDGILLGHDVGDPYVWLALCVAFGAPDGFSGATWWVHKSADRWGEAIKNLKKLGTGVECLQEKLVELSEPHLTHVISIVLSQTANAPIPPHVQKSWHTPTSWTKYSPCGLQEPQETQLAALTDEDTAVGNLQVVKELMGYSEIAKIMENPLFFTEKK